MQARVALLAAVAAGAAVAALAGCGASAAAGPAAGGKQTVPTSPTSPVSPGARPFEMNPMALVGSWRLEEATGEEPGAVLHLGDELTLDRRCGNLTGSWRADTGGLFISYVYGGSQACMGSRSFEPPAWVTDSTGYRIDGADRLLLDARGWTTARLVPAPGPTPSLSYLTKLLGPAAPVPDSLTPATQADLLGRWVPRSGTSKADTRFDANGGFHGTDGCNGQGGRYVVGRAGAIVAVTGPQTLIGCDNVDVGSWVAGAARIALDGPTLVLLDREGHELGRLGRTSA
ncbi:MAG: META domain-containing protein [Frankiaceae bacterium]